MSAYGAQPPRAASAFQKSTVYQCSNKAGRPYARGKSHISVHHLTLHTAREHAGLVSFLARVFEQEVRSGRTYPQEDDIYQHSDVDTAFTNYFFAGDCFIGVFEDRDQSALTDQDTPTENGGFKEAYAGRPWDQCIAGFYYIKPNYPGRSSHICNGGFIVPNSARGTGVGSALGQSYLHYAPLLGFKGSIFNLVYANNTASIKIWEGLGFTRTGVVPKGGRLVKADDPGQEEYIDAYVYYKEFQ